jgi:hypothetical protein
VIRQFLITLLAASVQVEAAAQSTGLVFATPDQLKGVPLASTPYSGATLPPSKDLSLDLPVPGLQGHQSSCVGWAIAYALKTLEEHLEERWSLLTPTGQSDPSKHFSPAFIYNQINHGQDGGSSFIDALVLLHSQGAATLREMPYTEVDFTTQPTGQARAEAARYRIDFWRQVNVRDPIEVKAQLNAGYPVLIGAVVDQGFQQAGPGFVWRQPIGAPLGGHAMLIVGYDDSRNAFRVVNSWGTGWGDNGFSWIDYAYFSQVVREGYVVKDAANGAGPVPIPQPSPQPPVASASFTIQNVFHNLFLVPNDPVMRFDGALTVPPGVSGSLQIVIQVYFDAGNGMKGPPVGSFRPQFSTVQGFAATGTPLLQVPPAGLSTTWFAFLPYLTLNVQRGAPFSLIQTNLVAEPILYINNFGVSVGQPVRFFVRL